MINWIVIAVLIVCGIVVVELAHLHHRLWVFLLIVFVIFLYVTVVAVNNSNEFDLSSSEGIMEAGKVYFSWLVQGFDNVKALAGKAIDMEWKSDKLNETKEE